MTRGLLAKRIRYDIDDRLPDVMGLRTRALDMHPDLFSSRFEPHDRTPVAIVCFHDCTESWAAGSGRAWASFTQYGVQPGEHEFQFRTRQLAYVLDQKLFVYRNHQGSIGHRVLPQTGDLR